jgi:hypothetical protein
MKTFNKRRLVIFLNFITLFSVAQSKYTLSGYVKELKSKELLIGVTVYTADNSAGSVSNDFGYYALELPAGEHTIIYNFIGQTHGVYLVLSSILEDYYNYGKLLNNFDPQNPFAEPVTLSSNIDGGLELFTLASGLVIPII